MWLEELLLMFFILAIILLVGLTRFSHPRRPSLEGIEDEEISKAYDRLSKLPPFKILRKMFVRELKKYDVTGLLVDVGCGPGYLVLDMARTLRNVEFVGVDLSSEMVKRASENLQASGYSDKTSFRVGGADKLPFDDEVVNFIVSTLSLHHWSNPVSAFDEFRRVLKPGGGFLVLDLRRDPRKLFYWWVLFAQNVALPLMFLGSFKRINEPTGSVKSAYTVSEAEQLISGCGYREVGVDGRFGWMFLWGRK